MKILDCQKKKWLYFLLFAIISPVTLLAQQPNILFILADDQSPFDLQIYNPSSELTTPVIDSLASQGLVFDGAYHGGSWSGAVCTPSRTMIMSGRTLWHAPGRENINASNPEMVPIGLETNTMAAIFNRAGYSTMRTCKTGNSYSEANAQFTIDKSSVRRGADDVKGSGWHATQVLDYLNERQATNDDKPFLIYYGFSHPHDTRNGKVELLEKYGAVNHTDENSLPSLNPNQPKLPANYLPAQPFFHGHYELRDEERVSGVWKNRDEATIRNEMGREFACSENIDMQIGKVLDKLRETGELENTYIIYTSDHGIAIGRHGFEGKQNLYEHTWRVPFIVSGPDVKKGRVQGNIYLYDVLGTLCDIAGITPPETVESKSFLPVLHGEKETVREVMYSTYCGGTKPGMRSVKKGDWKLIKYDVDDGKVQKTQLFNLAENPDELIIEHHADSVTALTGIIPDSNQVNLAANPKYADQLAIMEALLLEQMEQNDDPYRLWNQPPLEEAPMPEIEGIRVDFAGATVSTENVYKDLDEYNGEKAIDTDGNTNLPDLSTRWATNKPADGKFPEGGYTLEVEFPSAVTFKRAVIYDYGMRVNNFAIEVLVDGEFVTAFSGGASSYDLGDNVFRKIVELDKYYTATKFRYHILGMVSPSQGPSTWGVDLYTDETSSIMEEAVDLEVASPTCVSTSLYINTEISVDKVDIYNMSGRKMYSCGNLVQNTINLENLETGAYLVSITDTDSQLYRKKIFKK